MCPPGAGAYSLQQNAKYKFTIDMKIKTLGLLIACATLGAFAQDRALLETLVKKGMLTQQEAAQIAKESVAVVPGSKDTKSIKITGGMQDWYNWYQADNKVDTISGPAGEQPQDNGFYLRYVKLGVEAEVGSGWSAILMTDFGIEGAERNYLDRVVVSKQVALDYLTGRFDVGMQKVNFGLEQNEDDFAQITIERSLVTWFFTRPDSNISVNSDVRKNFGSRAVGLFWNGTVKQAEGLYYGLSVVGGNSYEGQGAAFISNKDGDNNLTFYSNAGYKNLFTIQDEGIAYDFGMNFGYASGGFVWENAAGDTENRSIIGINPYITFRWRGLTFVSEFFLQSVQDGKYDAATTYYQGTATPLGTNFTIAYRYDIGEWGSVEPVARYSWLQTGGMGVTGDGIDGDITVNDLAYDFAKQVFIGANWYVASSVKFSAGYEWAQYTGFAGVSGDYRTTSNGLRAQLQILF